MKEINVDVAVIGAGTAGLSAYRKAKESGRRVVLIEGGEYGTTCARVGCMPSKLLIAAAEAAHSISKADAFGINAGEYKVDGRRVMQRVRSERDRFVGFVLRSVEDFEPGDKLRGYARFITDTRINVSDHTTVNTKSTVIATGSAPSVPEMFSGVRERVITSDDVFYWNDLPESVAVFGAGVIGLEIGQALDRLGVRTAIFGKGGAVGPLTDPDLIDYGDKLFSTEMEFHSDADIKDIELKNDRVAITYVQSSGKILTSEFDYVLAATGRMPNVKDLGLENTSVGLDDKGVPVFDRYTLRCGSSSIFVAGDANNELPLLHEASDEGKIAGMNASTYPDIRAGRRRTHLSVVFTDPQIALAGSIYNELSGCVFVTGEVSFEDQGRSRVMLRNKGLLKLYAEHGSGIFLGAEMMGPAAEHIGHLLSWAAQKRMTVPEMLEMPFYHPVVEEGLRTALRDANTKLLMGPPMLNACLECGPGS